MKKYIQIAAILALGVSAASCDDFLNDNRFPLSQQSVNSDFWNNEVNVQNQINYFYQDFAGYGNGAGTNGTFYFTSLNDDQCGRRTFDNWTYMNVPTASSAWNGPYTELRRAYYVLEGVEASNLVDSKKDNFKGQALLHIARQYYALVRAFGDVPLVKTVLDPANDAALYGPRTKRNEVMDYAIECAEQAAKLIGTKANKTEYSQDLANAVLTEMCLFEASWARYHAKDEARAKKYYEEAVKVGEPVAAAYPVGDDYTALYKSLRVAGGGYKGLTTNSEVIFMKAYEQGVFMHSIIDYSSASDGIAGLTKDAFDSYLFLDGKPAATTGLDNTDQGVADDETKSVSIENLLAVRDKRLSMVTYDHIFFNGMAWTGPNTAAMWSRSGYGVSKFDNFTTSTSDATTANKGYTSAPLFWGARVSLAVLEAKAELGTLTDADLTTYLAPMWKRAGFTVEPTVALLSGNNDPANDMNVSSLVWEIRRARRCELIMDDQIRYWDLQRWHQLDKLDTTKNPDIVKGAYVANAPVACENVTADGYADCSYGMKREFNDRVYLYPLPSEQISLNDKLTQNPGW